MAKVKVMLISIWDSRYEKNKTKPYNNQRRTKGNAGMQPGRYVGGLYTVQRKMPHRS